MSIWYGARSDIKRETSSKRRVFRHAFSGWLTTLSLIALVAATMPTTATPLGSSAKLSVSPDVISAPTRVTVKGAGFPKGRRVQLTLDGSFSGLPAVKPDRRGSFRVRAKIGELTAGPHSVAAVQVLTTAKTISSTSQLGSTVAATTLTFRGAMPSSTATTQLPSPSASPTPSSVFYVSTSGSDANPGTLDSPWRTIAKAAAAAPIGSTTYIQQGSYAPFSVTRAGLTFAAADGATVSVSGGTTAIVVKADSTTIRGLRVTGASSQGLWVDSARDVLLSRLTVESHLGHGIQVIRSSRVEISDSVVRNNKLSGIRELDGTASSRYLRNTVTGNGRDGAAYNGDGILIQGTGALVAGNHVAHNGDSTMYEHGIYAAGIAQDYRIENNTAEGNSASGIKASGSGRVTDNFISGSPRGLVFADDVAGTVIVRNNTISATVYAILVTANCRLSRYDSDENLFEYSRFGYLGQNLDLVGWRTATGLDLNSK